MDHQTNFPSNLGIKTASTEDDKSVNIKNEKGQCNIAYFMPESTQQNNNNNSCHHLTYTRKIWFEYFCVEKHIVLAIVKHFISTLPLLALICHGYPIPFLIYRNLADFIFSKCDAYHIYKELNSLSSTCTI